MVYIFKNDKDYVKRIDNEKIINITGLSKSGKSTQAKKISLAENMKIIEIDHIFSFSKKNDLPEELYNHLKNKFEFIDKENIVKNTLKEKRKIAKEYSNDIYIEICKYLKKNKERYIIIGTEIYSYVNPKEIKGTIYIKQTSIFKCILRNIKCNKLKPIHCFKKNIKMIFVNKKIVNNFIKEIENL